MRRTAGAPVNAAFFLEKRLRNTSSSYGENLFNNAHGAIDKNTSREQTEGGIRPVTIDSNDAVF